LVAQAGYPEGFEMKIITMEAWKLEAQIISKMLERIGLTVEVEGVTVPGWIGKVYVPRLDRPPEQQDWDIVMFCKQDMYGHVGARFLDMPFIEDTYFRWIEYDPLYEKMWKRMAQTVDRKVQEEMLRELVEYISSRAHCLFIYSPVMLYAVNKEVNLVPQEFGYLRLKETSVTENHWSLRGKNK
jgi:ABC-type transport system substrate-binding protein